MAQRRQAKSGQSIHFPPSISHLRNLSTDVESTRGTQNKKWGRSQEPCAVPERSAFAAIMISICLIVGNANKVAEQWIVSIQELCKNFLCNLRTLFMNLSVDSNPSNSPFENTRKINTLWIFCETASYNWGIVQKGERKAAEQEVIDKVIRQEERSCTKLIGKSVCRDRHQLTFLQEFMEITLQFWDLLDLYCNEGCWEIFQNQFTI